MHRNPHSGGHEIPTQVHKHATKEVTIVFFKGVALCVLSQILIILGNENISVQIHAFCLHLLKGINVSFTWRVYINKMQ